MKVEGKGDREVGQQAIREKKRSKRQCLEMRRDVKTLIIGTVQEKSVPKVIQKCTCTIFSVKYFKQTLSTISFP